MDEKRVFCWTQNSLEGAACALVVKWFHYGASIAYETATISTFRDKFNSWLLHNEVRDYDLIYVLNLDVSKDQDLIDHRNVTIIDSHINHINHTDSIEFQGYAAADAVLEESSSTVKLLYKTLRERKPNVGICNAQKVMIALADDYASYNLMSTDSSILNTIYWNTQNRFTSFMEQYKDGFKKFTPAQLSIYKLHLEDVQKTLDELKYFENKSVRIGKNRCHIIATTATKHMNEISDYIIESFAPDVAIIVNLNSNHISFRRHADSSIDVGAIAKLIADGGGSARTAGGVLTPRMLEFMKLLTARQKMRKVVTDE